MHLGLHDTTLPELVRTKFAKAKTDGELIFSATQLDIIQTKSGTPFQLRYCPALAKKPKADKDSQAPKTSKPDPFDEPSPSLLVASVPEHKPTHIIVLNKYPVISQHFILATKTNKQQTHMLEPEDLSAAYACIREWEEATGGRLFGFFNSGDHSGASQAHRHLQFLPVDEMKRDQNHDEEWEPLIELILKSQSSESGMRSLPDFPFKHFAMALPTDPSTEQLHATYTQLYDAASEAVRSHIENSDDLTLHPSEGGDSDISYNLALTSTGMAICPRRREAAVLHDEAGKEVVSVALNGTILAGTLMVKLESEWEGLKKDAGQLDSVLEAVGIPA
ncbi:hypothetical protein BT93_L4383 [Corymbia citriodora subsp. variegata]|uniref:Uncharacterized protein n=1 Tax=Corymbia citriodora subsp. variegata TaxID=360336 RepID=A0A8T0CFX6_CORYI|nr:hypothetical protein BT93_L4383 [Corymbia citriodora subsp. variegata]